jgi:hypothetical protein
MGAASKLGSKAASEIIKFMSEFGITATKKQYGSGASGVGGLTDEQLGKGLNKFADKKTEKTAVKNAPKPKPKKKPESPPRDTANSATQKGLRFRDKPEVDIEVESDASRSVTETNMTRGAASAGRSTNAPGKTNIGSKSIANFIQDQRNASPGMNARNRQNKAYAEYIKAAPNAKEKAARQAEFDKIKAKREKVDTQQAQTTANKSAQTRRGQKRERRTDYVTQDGEIIGKPTQQQINAAIRNAEARDATKTAKRIRDNWNEMRGLETGKGQLESAGPRKIDTSDRMIQDAKQALIAVFGREKGTKLFNQKMSGAKTKQEFLVEIRSMVRGNSQGQKGTRPSETGAIVGQRKSNLKLVDRSNTKQPGRREVTSRRGKSGNSEVDAPMARGGMATKKRTGSHDHRKTGLTLSVVDRRKKR